MSENRGPDSRAPKTRNPNSDGGDYPSEYGGECPYCGEGYGQLPDHLTYHCEEKPE